MNNLKKYKWPVNSALFHTTKGAIFIRDELAFKVKEIYSDQNELNLKIDNEPRLKELMFTEISKRYNSRIIKHQLKYNHITDIRNLKLIKFKLIRPSDEDYENSGTFSIYPRVFICNQCNRYRYFRSDENILTRCETRNCNGCYEQLSLLKYCEVCGKVEEFYYRCEDREKHPPNTTEFLRLIRPVKDNINTWKFRCNVCGLERDPFNMWCTHKDADNKVKSDASKTKFKPITIREGGVFTPQVITTVDLPNTEAIGLPEAEYIMLGIYLGYFDELKELLVTNQSLLDLIEKMYFEYKDESLKKREYLDEKRINPQITSDEFERRWELKKRMNIFKNVVHDIKNIYEAEKFNKIDFNNFNALKGMFYENSIKTYLDFCNEKEDSERKIKIEEYKTIKDRFKIIELSYLPRIKLVSSCIGYINGMNKFYEREFVPHFEPIWKDKNRQTFNAYCYPYETEGILIEFNKRSIAEWLFKNNIITVKKDESDFAKIFLDLKEGTKAYDLVYTLLHTISHLLLRNASVHTGIDADSCGEKIFTNNCAILIYSASNINTGGFQFLFENSLFQLFNEIKIDLNKCIYDPLCQKETGSCFSCLYLAEHVCCNFNQNLDRNVLLGEGYRGIDIRFWEK